jgi:hypothetical protein
MLNGAYRANHLGKGGALLILDGVNMNTDGRLGR